MSRHTPEVTHRSLDRCDDCGRLTHKIDLVRETQETLLPVCSNELTYSSYSSSGWACSATDAGAVSLGNKLHLRLDYPTAPAAATVSQGIQTWTGNGTYRSTVAVDASAASSVVFSASVGPHQTNSSPSMTVVLGLCDSDGSNAVALRTWHISAHKRVWWYEPISHITKTTSALYFYITVTNAGKWYVDDVQVELSALRPGQFHSTVGAAFRRTAVSRGRVTKKLCQDCYRPVFKNWAGRVVPEPPDVVNTDIDPPVFN